MLAVRNLPRVAATASATLTSTRHTLVRYSSTMHDNDPDVLEAEKARNLQRKTPTAHAHAPGWNEVLATTSEASVKADRAPGTPAELQETTIDYIHARHSPDDRVAPIRSMYKRDTVEGPLSQASGVEDTEGHQELVKKTIHKETTEVYKHSTPSEDNVKADRGEI